MKTFLFLRSLFSHYLSYLPVLILFGVFWFLVFYAISLRIRISLLPLFADPLPGFSVSSYPVVSGDFPFISAQSAVVMEASSGVFVYARHPEVVFSPASTTKMMTALVGLDHFKPSDVLTAQGPFDVEGSGLGLVPGEKMAFQNLLYGMFLLSANDAAQMVAENYPGGTSAFVTAMNEKAAELSLYHTHFVDPAGLIDDGDFTTASDLVRLASFALEQPLLASVSGKQYATISSEDGILYPLQNRNILLGKYGIVGGKTGFTDLARDVLVTSALYQGHTFYTVVMRSNDRFGDTASLLQYIEGHISYQ